MFSASNPSRSGRGSGTINITTTAITSAAIASSAARTCLNSDLLDLRRIQLDGVVSHAVFRTTQVPDEGQMDLAANHTQDALELARRQLQARAQRIERGLDELLFRLLDPAKRGHAMHAVDRAD